MNLNNKVDLNYLIDSSPVGIAIFNAETFIVEKVNRTFTAVFGKPDDAVFNRSFWETFPEISAAYPNVTTNVILEGQSFNVPEQEVMRMNAGQQQPVFASFTYTPLKNEQNKVCKIAVWVTDTTAKVQENGSTQQPNNDFTQTKTALTQHNVALKAQVLELTQQVAVSETRLQAVIQQLPVSEQVLSKEIRTYNAELALTNEELLATQHQLLELTAELEQRVADRTLELTNSEARLRSIFEQSPLAFCILEGPDQIISAVNKRMLTLWGKNTEVIGKTHTEIIIDPNIAKYHQLLKDCYYSGKPYFGTESRNLLTGGKDDWIHFNFTYQPIKNTQGKVSSILIVVDDMTERIVAREETQRISEQFETAVNAAHIGVWNIDPTTRKLEYSAILAQIFGYEGENLMTFDEAIAQITEEYQAKLITEIDRAIAENNGRYDIIFAQRRFNDNQLIWIRSFGKVTADEQAKPVYFSGVILDITQQINTRIQIENLNEELAAINEELAATNEELIAANEELGATNEELNDANYDLTASNYALVQARNTLELANKKLAESEQTLQLTIESADLALWSIDIDDNNLCLSKQYRTMFGLPQDGEIVNDQVMSCVELADVPIVNNIIKDAVFTGKNINAQYRIRNRVTSELKYIKSVGKVITNEWGKPLRVIGANLDITQDTEAFEKEQRLNIELEYTIEQLAAVNEEMAATNEELMSTNEELIATQNLLQESLNEVEASKNRFKSIIHSSPVGMALLRGGEMIFEEVNQAFLHLINKDGLIIGKSLLEILPEFADQPILKIMYDTYQTGQENQLLEMPVTFLKNGEIQQSYFNIHYSAYIENGRITGMLQTGIDVTEQVLARMKIENMEENLRLAVDATQIGTYSFNLQTSVMTVTSQGKKHFGFTAEDEIGFDQVLAQVREDYREIVLQLFHNSVAKGDLFEQDYPVIGYYDQKLRWIRGLGRTQHNNSGQKIYSGITIDITEQKIDDQRKSDFISMVSHELKTPLTSLKAYVQVLQKKAQQNEDGFTLTTLTRASNSIYKMTSMINGFLNVSRLESGKIQLEMAMFDMMTLLTEVEQDASITVTSHRFEFLPVTSNFVLADREKISQVITNLISNAVKYSPAGSTISVACVTKGKNVEVSVRDNGMGINRQDLDKVFDRYYRAQNLQMNNISGFGIGLYLCTQIIERHKGQIGADSEPGKGSTFYFTLPLA